MYVLLGVPFALLGATLSVDALVRWRQADASQGWPTVQGEVTYAEVQESRSVDGNTELRPVVGVVYTVDGQPYESDRFTYGRGVWLDKDFVKVLMAPYGVSAAVRVHYNPEDPGEAVLQPGERGGLGRLAVSGLVLMAVGAVAMIKGMRPGMGRVRVP
jgi:hypothetical protein